MELAQLLMQEPQSACQELDESMADMALHKMPYYQQVLRRSLIKSDHR